MNIIPLGLRQAIETGECVLFIGAGIGYNVKNKSGKCAPTGSELAALIIDHFNLKIDPSTGLADVAEITEIRHKRKELENFVKQTLSDLEPDENLQWLFSLRWKAIYTTNFDYVIQRAYEILKDPVQNPITISLTSELKSFRSYFEVPVYHIHGTLFGTPNPQIVITTSDYAKFKVKREMLFGLLKNDIATSTILYIGYANRDPNWQTVYEEMKAEFLPSKLPLSFRVTPDLDAIRTEILKANGIETINSTLSDFIKSSKLELVTTRVDNDILSKIKEAIPFELLDSFNINPSPVIRLLRSWIYVKQASFSEHSNLKQFLNGDRPNWSLIAKKEYFERDVEEQVYDSILDFLTSSSNYPYVQIVLGSAGYGVSTLLMTLATKLIDDRITSVFMHLEGSELIEGDIEFAASIFSDRPVFFIDNAADYVEQIQSVIQRFKETKKSCMFILGERINEWHQLRNRIVCKEFEVGELSEPEIIRLISFLEHNGFLNKLEHLPQELRISTIKEKHNKQLLVVMKEATEGKSFDAIIEDEYRGIQNDLAKRLYLIVSCFYQHGALVRDKLLADLLNIDLIKMYRDTQDSIEGIVLYDQLDPNEGLFAARTRHRLIAAIVWERCGIAADRDLLIQEALNALNLMYSLDRTAFEDFIKSDRLVDSISSFDGRTKFFETACRKDPENAYVKQHYARMLNRSGKSEIALSQIDDAIKINSKSRILFHTKGKILADLAIKSESMEIARRRLTQSESNYKTVMSMYDKDEYSYYGLAELYLEWAKKITDEQEKIDYISRAEEIISTGLNKVKFREGLWIISSNIKEYLGNESYIDALEKAVNDNPSSIYARYCLGRTYRKIKEYEKAKSILYPIIKNHTEEYRSYIEYALSQILNNEPYNDAIAILEISTLYGYSDAKYISLLGGLQILSGNFTAADKTFNESVKHPFTSRELNTVLFRPKQASGLPMRIEGKVVKVKAGYALIENKNYPNFLCPGSKFNGLLLNVGMNVSFEVAFCAKGSVADKPLLTS